MADVAHAAQDDVHPDESEQCSRQSRDEHALLKERVGQRLDDCFHH